MFYDVHVAIACCCRAPRRPFECTHPRELIIYLRNTFQFAVHGCWYIVACKWERRRQGPLVKRVQQINFPREEQRPHFLFISLGWKYPFCMPKAAACWVCHFVFLAIAGWTRWKKIGEITDGAELYRRVLFNIFFANDAAGCVTETDMAESGSTALSWRLSLLCFVDYQTGIVSFLQLYIKRFSDIFSHLSHLTTSCFKHVAFSLTTALFLSRVIQFPF